MKKKTTYLAALSVALVLSASMGSAWAYFTTNVTAQGGYRLRLGNTTTIDETVTEGTKHVSILNSEDSQPVYVRVRAFAGSDIQNTLVYSGANWSPGADGYYYYSEIVEPGQSTGVLDILIPKLQAPVEGTEEPQDFNVAVIYESTPVQYDENGDPYADWNITLGTGDVEGGVAS